MAFKTEKLFDIHFDEISQPCDVLVPLTAEAIKAESSWVPGPEIPK